MKISLLHGKWFVGVRIGNLGIGIGRPSDGLRGSVDRARRHQGI